MVQVPAPASTSSGPSGALAIEYVVKPELDLPWLQEIGLSLGTIDDPHLVGSLGIKGGAFEVPELGTAYTGLDTQVVFADDRVNVQTFSLTDDNGELMRIGGSLSVHEGQLGAFQLVIESQNFEVIDNRLGDVQMTSLLAVEGTLAEPKLVGNIELDAARVEVDRVFDLLGGNVYALSPQDELPPVGTTTLTREGEALQQSAEAEARMAAAASAGTTPSAAQASGRRSNRGPARTTASGASWPTRIASAQVLRP